MRKYDYHNSTAFIIKCTAKVFETAFDQALRKKTDITVAQSRIIGTLALVKNGITQKEIANRIGIEAPTIVPIIDKLQEQGIVLRKPDPNDRRNNLIFLTAKAEAKWESIIECALWLERISRKGISEEDLEITKNTLCKLAQNITDIYSSSEQVESDTRNSSLLVGKQKRK